MLHALSEHPREPAAPPADAELVARSKQLIEAHEGRCAGRTWNALGRPIIGVGFDLDGLHARTALESLGASYADVRDGRATLADAQIDALLQVDVERAVAEARGRLPGFDALPPAKQAAVVDLVFALGASEFPRFHRTVEAIERGDWERSHGAELEHNGGQADWLVAADEDS